MKARFLCMANSDKTGGRCVAGLRIDGQGWIRPVSDFTGGTLYPQHYISSDRSEAALLDVLEVEFIEHQPEPYQPENWLVSDRQWKLINKLEPKEAKDFLKKYIEAGPYLFGNDEDRVYESDLKSNPVDSSLTLVHPEKFKWNITTNIYNRRQTRASFNIEGIRYSLSITDPVWKQRLSHLDFGIYNKKDAGLKSNEDIFFTISLGGAFRGACYKLVAGVIIIPR